MVLVWCLEMGSEELLYLCIKPAARYEDCVEMARTQPVEDCMMVARMKRLSTPVALALSMIDS